VLGFVVDRVGYNPLFVLGALVAVLGSHFMLAFSTITPYVPMVHLLRFYLFEYSH
jgi:hypothetical protein